MKRLLPLSLTVLLAAGCSSIRATERHTGPWNLAALKQAPAAEWGGRTGLVQEGYYQGEPYRGNATRVFAYLGRPATGQAPFPAMDTAGGGPNGPLPDGGPDQADTTKFRDFTDDEARDMWTYHAVSAVIRGVSLLATLPEVDQIGRAHV